MMLFVKWALISFFVSASAVVFAQTAAPVVSGDSGIVPYLVSAIIAEGTAIGVLWAAYVKRTRECEREKDNLQKEWRDSLKAVIDDYKGTLRGMVEELRKDK